MRLNITQIDAFADRLFEGNPAAVMPLPSWLPDDMLQRIAAENNLSETAFYTEQLPDGVLRPSEADAAYHLRWFTPAIEVNLCGHATLATAGQLFDDRHPDARQLSFWTMSGWLHVTRGQNTGELVMDFPTEPLVELPGDDETLALAQAALGVAAERAMRATDLVLVLPHESDVRSVAPDFTALSRLPVRGVIITAPADQEDTGQKDIDFVSRWFSGFAGIGEDPVTGSAHSQIAPYWAERLGRDRLVARQLSARGGTVSCAVKGDRVSLGGRYHRYLDGTVTLP